MFHFDLLVDGWIGNVMLDYHHQGLHIHVHPAQRRVSAGAEAAPQESAATAERGHPEAEGESCTTSL